MALVVSNRKGVYGIRRAVDRGVPVVYFPLAPYSKAGRSREEYDADLASLIKPFNIPWVVLAGWMHVMSGAFLRQFPLRVVNLHPALPGTFPGTHAIQRAYAAYRHGQITHTGVMMHLIPDKAVEAGPIVAQAKVPIRPEDTLDDLETRMHATEHTLLVQALHDLLCHKEEVLS